MISSYHYTMAREKAKTEYKDRYKQELKDSDIIFITSKKDNNKVNYWFLCRNNIIKVKNKLYN